LLKKLGNLNCEVKSQKLRRRTRMLEKTVALVASVAIATSSCASASGPGLAVDLQAPGMDRAVLVDYLQRLPAGTRVRVERIEGTSFRGTLMRASPQSIVVQKHTRLPEAPISVSVDQLARVTLDSTGSSIAKTIGIGVASGAATSLGVFLLLLMLYGD
jgi:hypothetical protein